MGYTDWRHRGDPMHRNKTIALILAMLAVSVLSLPDLRACSTPVFRYALERWPADYFPAVVFHRGKLSAEHKAVLDVFRGAAKTSGANVGMYDVDLGKKMDKGTAELWKRHKSLPLPCLVVTYSLPYSGRGRPRFPKDPFPPTIWSGKLTKANALALVDSPVRKEIARRIIAGDSAVWIILEPGKGKPAKAAAPAATKAPENSAEKPAKPPAKPVTVKAATDTLGKTLAKAEKIFAIKPGPPAPAWFGQPPPPANLKVAFSTIRVSRSDPAERMLVAMLLRSEKDLLSDEYAREPMVFPMFGRGRVLWALVGKGISEDNILESCAYVTGACSCEVKWQNPGTDLLFSKNWDKALHETMVEDEPIPMLRGMPERGKSDDKGTAAPKPKVETDAKATPPKQPAAKER